ncbi:MAG: helix-turn-helix transcriptional regulator [Candidatus Margulisiibacteriota bacterium]
MEKIDDNMRLWEIIKERRLKSGLSQKELAKLAEAKEETIMHIEIGRAIPTDETIWAVGAILCLSRGEIQECLALATEHKRNRQLYHAEYVLRMASRFLDRKRR